LARNVLSDAVSDDGEAHHSSTRPANHERRAG
jgi:hypothetical protein